MESPPLKKGDLGGFKNHRCEGIFGKRYNQGRYMDSSFLKALALARPDPGGGAAAAHSAALGLALLEKVVRLEHQRRGPARNPGFPWDDLLARVSVVSAALLRLQEEDVKAYCQFARARTSGDPESRDAALEEAVACPLRIMQQAQDGLALMAQVGAGCGVHLISDLLVACELLGAAFRGAHHIARANLPLMPRDFKRAVWAEELTLTVSAVEAELQQVRAELIRRQAYP
jgi:formiminotetrahydrofolate cyclodeaminase